MTATTESDSVDQSTGDERLAYSGFLQRMLIRPEIVGVAMSLLIYFAFWGVSDPFASGGATLLVLTATVGFMAVAAFAIHGSNGFLWTNGGYEYPLMWGVVALAILFRGAGTLSVDAKLGREI